MKQTIDNVRLKPKLFWEKVDSIFDDVKKWVLANCGDTDYQCCGRASDILYRLLIDWGIEKYGDESVVPCIVIGFVRNIEHHWVEIAGFIFDSTLIQFNPELTMLEYAMGIKYVEDEYDVLFKSDKLLHTCKSIRPDIY